MLMMMRMLMLMLIIIKLWQRRPQTEGKAIHWILHLGFSFCVLLFFPILDFGFGILNLGFWIFDFEFWILTLCWTAPATSARQRRWFWRIRLRLRSEWRERAQETQIQTLEEGLWSDTETETKIQIKSWMRMFCSFSKCAFAVSPTTAKADERAVRSSIRQNQKEFSRAVCVV